MDMMALNLGLIRIRHARRMRQDGLKKCEDGSDARKIDVAYVSDMIGEEKADRYIEILRRYRADDEGWVTIKGTHVLLNEKGEALSGGKLKGMTFAKAKSTRSKNSKTSTGGKGKNAGEKPGAEPVAKKDPAVLRKTATDASQKCVDIRKDIRYGMKLAGMTPDQLNQEKTDAETQITKLTRSAKRADTVAKKAEKEVEQLMNGMTREELDKELEKKRKEKNDAFIKAVGTDDQKEYDEGMKEYTRLRDEFSKLNETAMKADKIKTLKEKAEVKADELAQAKEYHDAVNRKLNGEMADVQSLKEAYKTAAAERDKAVLEAFSSAGECENSQQATDYLRAKGYFKKNNNWTDDGKVDITKMTSEHAVANAAQVERFMEDYPFLKGRMDGIDCHNFEEDAKADHKNYSNTLGYANGTRICLPEGYYGSHKNVSARYRGDIKKSYETAVERKYHPQGTDYKSVIDHELTHAAAKVVQQAAMANGLDFPGGRIENEVMKRVQMKLYGSYSRQKERDVRKMVSGYAANNQGVTSTSWGDVEHSGYGRNTEFLAEAMAEARCSKNPSDVARAAREAFEEIIKEAKLR